MIKKIFITFCIIGFLGACSKKEEHVKNTDKSAHDISETSHDHDISETSHDHDISGTSHDHDKDHQNHDSDSHQAPAVPNRQSQMSQNSLKGTVISTMDGGGYTYVEIKVSDGKVYWAAGPKTPMKAGKVVEIPSSVPMENFHSKSMDRTFKSIFFVSSINIVGESKVSEQAPAKTQNIAQKEMKKVPAQKAEGTYTIEELFKNMKKLKDKKIKVKGEVTKFASGIMGKNFVHLKDGTGEKGKDDLTLTTQQSVSIGDKVTAEGLLVMDRDFGMGYFYKIIIEETTFSGY